MPTTEAKPKNQRLPGMDATPLERVTENFVNNKIEMTDLKVEQDRLADQIIMEMKKEKRETLTIAHEGLRFTFEIIPGEEKLSCKKETKEPATKVNE